MNNCNFCSYIKGDKFTEIIFETNNFYVMLNEFKATMAGPMCMVIPKKHIKTIYNLNESLAQEMMTVIITTSNLLRATYNAKGIRIWQKNGKAAGQGVEHLHFHIMPANSWWDWVFFLIFLTYYDIRRALFKKQSRISSQRLANYANDLRKNIKTNHQ